MTEIDQQLQDALGRTRPHIEKTYCSIIQRMFEQTVKECGPDLKGVSESIYAISFTDLLEFNLDLVDGQAPHPGPARYIISDAKLLANASSYADSVISKWRERICRLGEWPTRLAYQAESPFKLDLSGRRGGDNIQVRSSLIIMISGRGLIVNFFNESTRISPAKGRDRTLESHLIKTFNTQSQ